MDALKILVVDDESRMRKLVKDFLTKKNFQVLINVETPDANKAIETRKPVVSKSSFNAPDRKSVV